jgi:glycosyltransferase involved in cell wall biosynthesis
MDKEKILFEAFECFKNCNYEEAKNLYLNYNTYNNTNTNVNCYLAICYFKLNDVENSLFYALKYFHVNPSDSIIASLLVTLNINMGQIEEVKKIISKHLEFANDPDKDMLELYKKLFGIEYFKARYDYPKLNILFIQQYAGIRCYKYAKALKSKGHKITLLYGITKISENYKDLDDDVFEECIKINSIKEIWNYVDNFDVVHCHNEPDFFTVAALTGNRPIIHDTADLISLRDIENPNTIFFEAIANRGSKGRIYSTIYQKQKAEELYDLSTPSLVFGNYISKDDAPKHFLPKLSGKDGNIHIVYQGSISLVKHRNFIDIFTSIANNNVHIHIYPARFDEQLMTFFSNFSNIHYHNPVSPKYLMTEMTQYDIGIIPWNLELGQKSFLDTTIANKLYEYLASGLPVLTSNVKSYNDYFASNKVGVVFNSLDEVSEKINYLLKQKNITDYSKYVKTYEDEIYQVEEFYFNLLKENLQHLNYKVRDKLLIENYNRKRSKSNQIKVNKINNKKIKTLSGNILIVIPYIEDVGGAAVTINLIVKEFVKRGNKVYLLANNISDIDLISVKKSFTEIVILNNYDFNIFPSEEVLRNFIKDFKLITNRFNISLVLSFTIVTGYYLEYCTNYIPFKLFHYVTYEPGFDGQNKNIKTNLLLNNLDRFLFLSKQGAQSVFNFLGLNYQDFSVNVVGVPIPDVEELYKKKKEYIETDYLKIIVVSRLAATKSFVINLIEDVGKLINKGYKIKVTIIGEGDYLPILEEIIRYYSIKSEITLIKSQYPLDYKFLQEFDVAVCMATTALITAALGLPTIYAIPTTWFNYFGYFSGYAGALGILGLDYDFFNDGYSPVSQKHTYYDLLQEILNRKDRMEFLKELSEISKNYITENYKLLNNCEIVDTIINL